MAVDSLGKGAFPSVPKQCLTGFESGHRPDRVVSGGPGQPEGSRARPSLGRPPMTRPPATPAPPALSGAGLLGIAADHGRLRAGSTTPSTARRSRELIYLLHRLRPGHLRHHCGAVGPGSPRPSTEDEREQVGRKGRGARGCLDREPKGGQPWAQTPDCV